LAGDSVVWYMQQYSAAAAREKRGKKKDWSNEGIVGINEIPQKKAHAKISMLETANFLFSVEVTGSST
jgi:hypothetical protein